MIGLPSFLGASLRSAPAFQGPPGALPGSAAGAQRTVQHGTQWGGTTEVLGRRIYFIGFPRILRISICIL